MNDRKRGLVAALLVLTVSLSQLATAETTEDSAKPVLWQPWINVFRRVSGDINRTAQFYEEVIGLKPLAAVSFGSGTRVTRFQVGALEGFGPHEFKLSATVPNRTYVKGGVQDATGVRLVTFFFADESALIERFERHGLPAPRFESVAGINRRAALATDPDGQWIELVIAQDEKVDRLEVGVTVSDLEVSRSFYRDFVGLEELPAFDDPRFGVTTYPFRHGATTINIRRFGSELPADTGSGGMQYFVSDAEYIDALAKARNVSIDQPLGEPTIGGFRFIWLEDPDGITNYFNDTPASRNTQAARAR